MFQYGSDEFGQDSPRYTSPKAAALYADPYYIGESLQFASHSRRRNYRVGNRDYEGNRVIITMTEREKERRTKIVASPARFSRGRKCRPPPTVELGSETRPLLKVNGGKFLLEPIDPNVARTDPVLIAGLFALLLFSPRACTRLYLVEIAYVTISNER